MGHMLQPETYVGTGTRAWQVRFAFAREWEMQGRCCGAIYSVTRPSRRRTKATARPHPSASRQSQAGSTPAVPEARSQKPGARSQKPEADQRHTARRKVRRATRSRARAPWMIRACGMHQRRGLSSRVRVRVAHRMRNENACGMRYVRGRHGRAASARASPSRVGRSGDALRLRAPAPRRAAPGSGKSAFRRRRVGLPWAVGRPAVGTRINGPQGSRSSRTAALGGVPGSVRARACAPQIILATAAVHARACGGVVCVVCAHAGGYIGVSAGNVVLHGAQRGARGWL